MLVFTRLAGESFYIGDNTKITIANYCKETNNVELLIRCKAKGESVSIGDNTKIRLLRYCNRTKEIKLGIDAPKHIPIHREEIYQRITDKSDKR